MSVIQKIRDKYARWAVIAIGVSLLGFILMDAFAGRTGLFNDGPTTTLGKVNDKEISYADFSNKVSQRERQMTQQGQQLDDQTRAMIRDQHWNAEVENLVMAEEYEKLGLSVTEKELKDILYGANPPADIRQAFTDEKGVFNALAAQQEINRQLKDAASKPNIEAYFESLKQERMGNKYMALMMNSIYFPKWFLEQRNADNALTAKAAFASVPYVSIPDSTVKVSDDEIRAYMNEHRSDFEQKEESRSITYVLFNAAPSSADSAAARADIEKNRTALQNAKDHNAFISQQGSSHPYFDGFVARSALQIPNVTDSIIALPVGNIYGPYLDGDAYVLAKKVEERILPDSVKSRHILISAQTPDSVAKMRIDSIAQAIAAGASFDSLNNKYSDDVTAKAQKGEMTFSSTQIQSPGFAPEFGKFILLEGKTGDKKTVKTQFGWHYIEILDQMNVQPHYKVAYLGKRIYTSKTTDQQAHNQANMFAGKVNDVKSFNEQFEKTLLPRGMNKMVATDISPLSHTVTGLPGYAREFVKKVYEADQGEVIASDNRVGDYYVVAVVTEVNEAGMMSVTAARRVAEPAIKNKKKAEKIIANIGKFSTVEEVASKFNTQVMPADSVRFGGDRMLGPEPRVVGAIFNPANKGKVIPEPIAGQSGVYVVRVDNIYTVPVEGGNIAEQQKALADQSRQSLMMQLQQGMQQGFNPITQPLREAAKIKDNRSKFF